MSAGKILVGLGTVAAVGVPTGLYMGGVISFSEEIPWRPLSEDTEFNATDNNQYNNKWGKKYARYLVGAGSPKTDSKVKNNDPWWNQKFKELETNKPSAGKFKDIDKATEGNSSLKNICDGAYKANTSNVKSSDVTDSDFSESDIWKYCSPLGQKPVTVSAAKTEETQDYTSKLGDDSDAKTKLVSIDDPKNALFWKIKQDEFFSGNEPNATTEAFFKDFYSTNKDKKPEGSLKEKCRAAYKLNKEESTSSSTQPKKDEVIKYCSLDGQ